MYSGESHSLRLSAYRVLRATSDLLIEDYCHA